MPDAGADRREAAAAGVPAAPGCLRGADVRAGLEQVGGEGAPQRVTTRRLVEASRADRELHCPLHRALIVVVVVTAKHAASRASRYAVRWQHVPPAPLRIRPGILPGQRMRQVDTADAAPEIPLTRLPPPLRMP